MIVCVRQFSSSVVAVVETVSEPTDLTRCYRNHLPDGRSVNSLLAGVAGVREDLKVPPSCSAGYKCPGRLAALTWWCTGLALSPSAGYSQWCICRSLGVSWYPGIRSGPPQTLDDEEALVGEGQYLQLWCFNSVNWCIIYLIPKEKRIKLLTYNRIFFPLLLLL